MTVKEITDFLETIAPPSLQEEYDNAGLLTGKGSMACTGALICLDVTEAIITEAIKEKCNLVIAHHPIIFKGIKKLNGKNYTERVVIAAIKNDIAIYAIHTNLDNILHGVNGKIAEKLGLINTKILQQKEGQLKKLVTFAPPSMAGKVREAVFAAGAGNIGKYSECSFSSTGISTFKPAEGANPVIGKIGVREESEELKLEFIFQSHHEQVIIEAMKDAHEYEEVAYDILPLGNFLSDTGSGLIGERETSISEEDLLGQIQKIFNIPVIRHTQFTGKPIKRIAICGGAGSFLIGAAKADKADIYITSDMKYHEFFDAEGEILLADIGHFESEQFTTTLLFDLLKEIFPNFALLKTGVNTNPVHYFGPQKN
ncbi:MAG: Nif3-like dinuclear metal center hexameric protein [Ferruginibacter sp.]